ncbi:hypothetical protein G7Y79_00001g002160 [Physcia stellaris]|nr:hypothetical protein G7Y79_00001g002160 [Physcia stellaris]
MTMTSPVISKSTSSSVVSQTSTDLYGHETWEDFAPRIHQLCRQLWPSESGDFNVEKLRGGSFNRIFGVQTPASDRLILRVPRYEFAQQEREMAILHYVRQHTSIPMAHIVFFDLTHINPLNEPHEHKLSVAEQWGQLLLSQLTVRNDFAGILDTITSDNENPHVYGFCPFEVDPEPEKEDHRLLSKQSILDIFVLQFERWNAADKRAYPNDPHLDHLDRLIIVAKEMDAAGLFGAGVFFSLCHLDLAPRNVMANISNTSNTLQITGVLDWDSTVFAPHFMNCEPPSWIWAWSTEDDASGGSDDFEDIHANDEPATEEDRALKRKFEDTVGVDLLKFFHMPHYRLARELFKLAMSGMRGRDPFDKADRLIQEWDRLQGKPQVTHEEEESDNERYHTDSADDEPYYSGQSG